MCMNDNKSPAGEISLMYASFVCLHMAVVAQCVLSWHRACTACAARAVPPSVTMINNVVASNGIHARHNLVPRLY